MSEEIGKSDVPGISLVLGTVPILIGQFLAQLLPSEISSLAYWQVIVERCLEMRAKVHADAKIEAEHGVLEAILIVVLLIVAPMKEIVAQIETELGTDAQEDTKQFADISSITGMGREIETLLGKTLAGDLQITTIVEGCHVDTQTDDGQLELHLRPDIETSSIGIIKRFALEIHLRQFETTTKAETYLSTCGAN